MKKTNCFIAIFVFAITSISSGGSYFTDRGSAQIGGEIGFAILNYHYHYENVDIHQEMNYFRFAPVFNYFPVRSIFIGPALAFDYLEDNYSDWEIGVRVGLAKKLNGTDLVPYISMAPMFVMGEYRNFDNDGFGFDMNGGLMILVKKNLIIQFGPGFKFKNLDRRDENRFYFNIGFSGALY